jgi:hypothetical protein
VVIPDVTGNLTQRREAIAGIKNVIRPGIVDGDVVSLDRAGNGELAAGRGLRVGAGVCGADADAGWAKI